MSSQGEEGWPLGLPPVALRMRLVEAFSAAGAGEASFVLNPTPSFSSLSSSDLDTESTGSFFPEKTITLGSLIGLAGASTGHPSFRHSLGSADDTSSMKGGPRRFITRFAWCRSEPSGAVGTNKFTSWSNLIRCKSCRGTYDYPDDNSSIGAPPSLGHFLDIERELEIATNNQAKVYINVMFEEDGHSSQDNEGINPLFDSGRANSPPVLSPRNNNSSSNILPAANNTVHSTSLTKAAANELQEHIPVPGYNLHLKPRHEATKQHDELLRLRAAVRSMHTFQKATALLKSKSQKHQARQMDHAGMCVLSCVSHIWGYSKSTSHLKDYPNEDENVDDNSHCSTEESKSDSRLEFSTPSNNAMSCYTNFSFDDSDSSVYFDDEDDPNMGNSRKQNTTDCEGKQEFEFCTPVVKSVWQVSMDENREVKLAERPCFTR